MTHCSWRVHPRRVRVGFVPAFEQVQAWAARQPKRLWRAFLLPGGTKGPRRVRALQSPRDRDDFLQAGRK
jgi:hypothetical protein